MNDIDTISYHTALDLMGLNCPLPILKTKAALAGLSSGEVLKVIFNTPESLREMRVIAGISRCTLQEYCLDDGSYILFFTQK